jgi:hypothetical protein
MTDTATTTIENKKLPGRPQVNIPWPDQAFTVEDLQAKTGLSKVTIYLKVKEALTGIKSDGTVLTTGPILETSGKQPTSQGRPRILYRKKGQPTILAQVAA